MKDETKTLSSQLQDLFQGVGLTKNEALLMAKIMLFPGMTTPQLQYQCGFKRMTTYRMLEKLEGLGFLKKSSRNGKGVWMGITLAELTKRIEKHQLDLQQKLQDIMRAGKTLGAHTRSHEAIALQRYTGDHALELYNDMHYMQWDYQCGFGDFESLSECFGLEFCLDWIDQRIRKSRQAGAYLTTTGKHTQYITGSDEEHLRNTVETALPIRNQWYEIFPENDVVLLFEKAKEDWSVLKINSKAICQSYFQLAQASL